MKHFLNNDARNAITFAGIFLLIAALATLFIKAQKPKDDLIIPAGGGH